MVKKQVKKKKFPSELRYDIGSKDWVVVATGRSKRPEMFKKEHRKGKEVSKKKCPFCNLGVGEKPTLIFYQGRRIPLLKGGGVPQKWTTVVIPNKYPAFIPSAELNEQTEGKCYRKMNAAGFHEVVVTRDNRRSL